MGISKRIILLVALATLISGRSLSADTLTLTTTPSLNNGTEGTSGTLLAATFTDTNTGQAAANFFATIAWGDGTTSAGAITGANGSFTINGVHTYAEEGLYAVALSLSDSDGESASSSGTATVGDAALSGAISPVSFTPGVPLTLSGSFSDANPFGGAADFTATINWGDFTTTAGTITGAAGSFSVTGTHRYAGGGSFSPSVSVLDDGGSLLTMTTTASSVPQPVPEPATFLLLGTGLLGVVGAARRKWLA